jgi:hypothetical protein
MPARSSAIWRMCAAVLAAAALAPAAACGQGGASAATTPRPHCPVALRAGWQQLADRVGAAVYCPAWLPSPLVGHISESAEGTPDNALVSVSSDRSYLASWNWTEAQTGEVHVILRGYPGRTAIPRCVVTQAGSGGQTHHQVPCFADPNGHVRVGRIDATLYTVNQGADQWHLLYAWRDAGGLYTVSQHVAAPLTYDRVRADLRRILANLVLVAPGG